MAEKENGLELSLSLSLSFTPEKPNPPPPTTTATPFLLNLFKNKTDAFQLPSSADQNAETRYLFRGTNVNRAIAVTECEEVIISPPNSTVSSSSGNKRNEREENDGERTLSSSLEVDEDGGETGARKKLRLSKEQAALLEETFKEHNSLNPKQKVALAKQLNLKPRQVEVWFQNRRARTKLKQTEVDCEYLKRCYDNLSEENIRLQKEVNELRALKLSPQFYMNNNPPTTLNMCPQCQRVISSAKPSSASCRAAHNKRPML